MPYITQERRDIINSFKKPEGFVPVAGDLVYWFYKQMVSIFEANSRFETVYGIKEMIRDPMNTALDSIHLPPALKGSNYNEHLCRALAWDEFYRKNVGPYEDQKLKENGDV